ncbi:MAG: RagB/SusD family nutrient uptake outer membrane protein [Proteiniphilum sp.]|jgi:hypothetical protein|uniref:RagB/SusD family nutrient uptake outer membrane protein n=1 Tax=Proteiniphilum sp. TaxID=1926877 RepID=UPI002B1EBFB8|nr:RagB/SusD family nutrient uptake outer membrane protein [Proteiniphilum sp.]MEA5127581.1 RagB/SusD family nutrient uptake outer membrane protein [Proteiniphilum sp.]
MKKNILKNQVLIILTTLLVAFGSGCNQFFDEVEPLTKISGDQLLASEKGILTLLAELYNAMPMEDFNYHPGVGTSTDAQGYGGFYIRAIGQGFYAAFTDMFTDDAIRSDGNEAIGNPGNDYWTYAYTRIRNTNLFLESIEKAKANQVLSEAKYTLLQAEAYFVRAYIYFGLVKRYGGVPIFEKALDNDYIPGSDNAAMYVSRNTEKETWDFVLSDLDKAIANLPETNAEGKYRINKYVAYALKSRVALYAASVAKFWNNAPLIGEAVDLGYVGLPASEASRYYQECINASKMIMDNTKYSLYMPNPTDPTAATINFQNLFLTENSEIIYSRAYMDGSIVSNQGHSYDAWYSPSQNHPGYLRHGRYSVTLDLVDAYEAYTDDGSGTSAKIVTREDGNENFYYLNPNNIDLTVPFKKYDDLFEPFAGKDARLHASIIVPGAMYKDTKIIMQGGLIRKNGEIVAYAAGSEEGLDGNTYYTYGAYSRANYSGFDNLGGGYENSNYSSTGFSVRKYLAENKSVVVSGATQVSTTSWIDFRLAEIYLNYAEAVAESGQGDATLAKNCLNQIRKRAAHTDEIPLTVQNVLKERRVELAFEQKRYDDMLRRREYHTFWNMGKRHSLVPIIDLREATPKYIFVRVNQFHDEQVGGRLFNPNNYYKEIPGTETNKLTKNPGY